jgi:hypothetical protein
MDSDHQDDDSMDEYGGSGHDDEYGASSHHGEYGDSVDPIDNSWAAGEGDPDSSEPISAQEGSSVEANAADSGVDDDGAPQMEFVDDYEDESGKEDGGIHPATSEAAIPEAQEAAVLPATPKDDDVDLLGTAASEPLELPALTAHKLALAEHRKAIKDLDKKLKKLQGASNDNLYGPQGEYWLLKGKCLKLDHQQYTYEVDLIMYLNPAFLSLRCSVPLS